MQRELSSFPFPPSQRLKLQNAGFITVEDIIDLKPSQLSKEVGVSHKEALDILKLVREEREGNGKQSESKAVSSSRTMSALDMLRQEHLQQNIITFSQQLDGILGGGVPLSKITEFCGAPGIGKTQICLQLCIDVQIPETFGGLGGEAIYIDTEGSFLVDRLADIGRAAVSHCQHIAQLQPNPDQSVVLSKLSLESLLLGVYYFRCHDYVELIAVVHTLQDFLKEHKKVKLVVVDSIAFHFRHDFYDLSLRTRLLNGMAQSFIQIASLNKLAVVLTNQMTTKFEGGTGGGSHLIPALGESWGHAATIRLVLYWHNRVRHALLYKSPSREEATVPYQITTGGIRDLYQTELETSDGSTLQKDELNHNPSKRQRLDD